MEKSEPIDIATDPYRFSCAAFVAHVGKVWKCSKTASAYSPIEIAKVMKAAPKVAERIAGIITQTRVLSELAPRLDEASTKVGRAIAWSAVLSVR